VEQNNRHCLENFSDDKIGERMKTEESNDLSSDFPFGRNAPQDSHDFYDSQRLLKTYNDLFAKNEKAESVLALPLAEYLHRVFEQSEEMREDDTEAWHSPVFFFTRLSKAHPAIKDLSSDKAMQAVGKIMGTWGDLPPNSDPWEHYFGHLDGDSAKLDFMVSWDAIRHVPFHSPLQNALALAEQSPLKPAVERGRLFARFISVAAHLQLLMPKKDIYLPTRAVAALLGCDQRTVSRLRKVAIQDGLLREVKRHQFNSQGRSKATAFQFAVARLPEGMRR
jgi:hypothetical protein